MQEKIIDLNRITLNLRPAMDQKLSAEYFLWAFILILVLNTRGNFFVLNMEFSEDWMLTVLLTVERTLQALEWK